ncbi:sigma-70 family RNA polymerase sigma factor [Sphingobacterium faecium]|uniref:RNA polymerase sigma factor n=1 Tax=Sphingobacterium faecium TaxID=34087 RepID=UPI0012912554|nr:sigma-70 family RNA polymerase sigma factor [Sphingobacterium faecium]MQP26014.1 sigma-70 family RNA polymerase sigma factor [Sphingobacterium faecium]
MAFLDESLFKNLFYHYYDRIYTGFYKKTNSLEVAQDLTQITFMKLWTYRDQFSQDISHEKQIFRKAKLVLIDWLRKEANQRKLIAEIQQNLPLAFTTSTSDLREELNLAIDKLPPARKKVFIMAYLEGYSHKEIAEELNISVKTVDAHVLKSLQQLRKLLALTSLLFFIFNK